MKEIADGRMAKLFAMSECAVKRNDVAKAKRYVALAERIGQKTNTSAHRNRTICKKCGIPLIPGLNCRTRLNNGKIKITCSECGNTKRIPYIGERK